MSWCFSDVKRAALPPTEVGSNVGTEESGSGECGGDAQDLDDTPPVSPNTRAADMSAFANDLLDSSSQSSSISDWLANIGYAYLSDKFLSRNIFSVAQLNFMTEQVRTLTHFE